MAAPGRIAGADAAPRATQPRTPLASARIAIRAVILLLKLAGGAACRAALRRVPGRWELTFWSGSRCRLRYRSAAAARLRLRPRRGEVSTRMHVPDIRAPIAKPSMEPAPTAGTRPVPSPEAMAASFAARTAHVFTDRSSLPGQSSTTQCVTVALLTVRMGGISGTRPASGHLPSPARKGPYALAWGEALAMIQETIQDPYAELERLDRDPLVHPVEHAGEIQVGGKPERREAEAPDAEPAE
jgi:hypothetical protein